MNPNQKQGDGGQKAGLIAAAIVSLVALAVAVCCGVPALFGAYDDDGNVENTPDAVQVVGVGEEFCVQESDTLAEWCGRFYGAALHERMGDWTAPPDRWALQVSFEAEPEDGRARGNWISRDMIVTDSTNRTYETRAKVNGHELPMCNPDWPCDSWATFEVFRDAIDGTLVAEIPNADEDGQRVQLEIESDDIDRYGCCDEK